MSDEKIAVIGLGYVGLPLVVEFGWTKEIEDRLLAPVPTWVVAAEKIVGRAPLARERVPAR